MKTEALQSSIFQQPARCGFSLIELLLAMTITLTVLGLTSGLLASSFNVLGILKVHLRE
jgi:prepilin-type N-terminal cleavage/methylation domain-containing protein